MKYVKLFEEFINEGVQPRHLRDGEWYLYTGGGEHMPVKYKHNSKGHEFYTKDDTKIELTAVGIKKYIEKLSDLDKKDLGLSEAKSDQREEAEGYHVGDTVKSKTYGPVTIYLIEVSGNKAMFFVKDKRGNTYTVSSKNFSGVIDSPVDRERRERQRSQLNRMNRRKYQTIIRQWVDSLAAGEDDIGVDVGTQIVDTIDNFILTEPEAVDYVKTQIQRKRTGESVRDRIQWDMEQYIR